MSKIFKLLISFIVLFYFGNGVFAASVDHFDVKLGAEEIAVDKTVDITIEAKDSNGNLVKNYKGTILIMSETDSKAVFPKEITDNTYSFKESDQGKVKFENGVIFKNIGKQEISVFDLDNEDILGKADINVIDEADIDNITINITSPSDGSILTNNYITLSGNTRKNHKVIIYLNGPKNREIKTESNNEGLFEKKIENIDDGDYTASAAVINSEGKEAGRTKEVKVTIKTKKPEFNSFKVKPYEIYPEDKITLEVKANKGLSGVKVVIDDNITELKEGKAGVYTGSSTAPKLSGDYDVEIKLSDDLGNEVNKLLPKELTVMVGVRSGCNPEDPTCEDVCDPEIEECEDVCDPEIEECDTSRQKIYKINNLRLTKLKTKSILSWDPIAEAVSYNIYKQLPSNQLVLIDNVKTTSYEVPITGKKVTYDLYVVEPVVIDGSGQTIKGQLSEVTEIQTGPKEILILVFLSFLLGLIIFIFKNKRIKL